MYDICGPSPNCLKLYQVWWDGSKTGTKEIAGGLGR